MRILCIDLSLHCGYAVIDRTDSDTKLTDSDTKLTAYGTIHFAGVPARERKNYPWSFVEVVQEHIDNVIALVGEYSPDVIVIEETNRGKNRYSQKMLEFLHHELLRQIKNVRHPVIKTVYLDTSAWRATLGIWMSKEQKKINAKINKAKREGGDKKARETKKALGVKGKFNKKHVAIAKANEVFNLNLKMKDNDTADAIMLGLAYLNGTEPSDDGT